MEPIVGIDLGTTNSEVAFIINNNAEIFQDNDNGIMPSCVGLNAEGQIIVGMEAKNQAELFPEQTVLSVKRLMGKEEKIVLGNQSYLPQEISAFILKALKERAEKKLNQKVSKAVITVPAYFTDAQRQATREAGEIAGLNVVRIINEPTAAALAYETNSSEHQNILIYDLGGGTFDVSIVKIESDVVEVLSSTGDNHLGGDDFDHAIMKLLLDYIQNELKMTIKEPQKLMARLKRASEAAKIELSSSPYVKIEEDHIGRKTFRDIHLSYELSRDAFEEMIDDDISRTMDAVNTALKDANLLPADIDKIILVGGSTRIPKISKMLEEKFSQLPHGEIDPDLCVALGAAIQAGREMGMDQSSILLDITPYTFGTSALGTLNGQPIHTLFVPLIRKNTKLPASRSEVFYTMVDGQENAEIKVYQGEHPNALDNVLINKYMFRLSNNTPGGSPIVLNYDLDINGILKMEAMEKQSGRKINAVIENAFASFSEEEISRSRRKIEEAWGNSEEESLELVEITDNLFDKLPHDMKEIIRQVQARLDDAPEEDRDEMIDLIEDIQDAIQEGNLDRAKECKKELEEILFYIGDE
ncbi:MAG: Hsp70 family protein [Candidatus Magnetomorum sp.]|nr:Hsp70 family protein [Candidatus Magnetomorum sp.]